MNQFIDGTSRETLEYLYDWVDFNIYFMPSISISWNSKDDVGLFEQPNPLWTFELSLRHRKFHRASTPTVVHKGNIVYHHLWQKQTSRTLAEAWKQCRCHGDQCRRASSRSGAAACLLTLQTRRQRRQTAVSSCLWSKFHIKNNLLPEIWCKMWL